MRWLIGNRQWLFSGAGVVLLGAVFNMLRTRFSRGTSVAPANGDKTLQSVLDGPAEPKHEIPSKLTPRSIIKAVAETPLLQQPDLRKQFVGVNVRWSGTLTHASKEVGGSVKLMILVEDESSQGEACFATVNPKDYPGLGTLKYGHNVRVSGCISSVEMIYIVLKDAVLEFEIE